jgi:glucose/arabinose dehydrogenase
MHRLKFLVPLCPVAWFVVLIAFGLTLGVVLNQFLNTPARASASFPTGFISETVVGIGLTLPTALAFAPNDTLFIAEKRGVVRVWQRGSLLPTPFIDLQDEVNDFHDRGLLGLAVHPNFPATPYIYLLYTYDPPGVARDAVGARVSRLLRVTADVNNTNVASTAADSRVVLLGTNSTRANLGNADSQDDTVNVACGRSPNYVQDCLPSDYDSHSIGTVTFGPDGKLYVGSGDGAAHPYTDVRALRALDLDSMAGKIFRLDPLTGKGLSDNPFYNGDPEANRSRVLSLGLRNPFRFALHPVTNELYVGDVGWSTWEEINIGRGKNFGWPCYEGNNTSSARLGPYANNSATAARCQQLYAQGASAVQAPAYAYDHADAGAAINGGTFYTGTAYPVQYRGGLFIADYNRNWIKYLTFDAQGRAAVNSFGAEVGGDGKPVQIVAGPDTNLYYIVLGAVNEVRRIRYLGSGNQPPVAQVSATHTSGNVPLTVQFSGASSYDPDAQPLSYVWNFGTGVTSTQANPTYTYTAPGTYTARLTVTDPLGVSASTQVEISAGNNRPSVTIKTPVSGTRYNVGSVTTFSGAATDVEDGNLSANIQWKANLHHNEHTHFNVFSFTGASGTFTVPDHGDDTYYDLCATVTDRAGLTSVTQCIQLRPHTVQYTFVSAPSGLQLNYAGRTYTTPFTVTTIPNSLREISAAATQGGLSFVWWSDGGARSHHLTISGHQTIAANYQSSGASDGGAQNVNWTNLLNTTATGNSLRKTSGSDDGTPDGSGISQQTLTGNGYLEFIAAGPLLERACGLTDSTVLDSADALDFAVVLTEIGIAEFRENGAYIGDVAFVLGDIFRIQIENGRANYYKNGTLLFSGNHLAAAQLRVAAVFNYLGAEVVNAKILQKGGGCSYGITPLSQVFTAGAGAGTVSVTTGAGCAWTALSNVDWLMITGGASGAGRGLVNYSVDANTGTQRAGTLTVAGQTFTLIQAGAPVSGEQAVVWTNALNVDVLGNVVRKTLGADDGSWDGSALSQQTLAATGYLEFAATGPNLYRACGLTDKAALGTPDSLNFAVVFTNTDIAEFREGGAYVGDARFINGDLFRITINGGRAHYYKNSVRLFTGRQAPPANLRAAAIFSYLTGELTNARLGTSATVSGAFRIGRTR